MEHSNTTPLSVLVTGGTGTLGSLVVTRLAEAGATARVLARGRHPAGANGVAIEYVHADLAHSAPPAALFEGIDVVVHLAGTAKGDDAKARHLLDAARHRGVRHLVFISVVGADRVPVDRALDRAMFGYFRAKLAAEQMIAGSGIPWSILRATQFQETLLGTARGMARLPLMTAVRGFRFQPIAATEVADRLVGLALGAPSGMVPEMGGPTTYLMADLLRSYLRVSGKHRLLVSLPLLGRAAAAVREGATLTSPDRAVGRRTWEELLAEGVTMKGDPHPAAM
jgi:uncharacterized protein YbjT (DUF2867 family)